MSNKFTINKGDYIDSRQFSREECEKFCELALEFGYDRGEWLSYYSDDCSQAYLGVYVHEPRIHWYLANVEKGGELTNNITAQFRKWLDGTVTPKSLLKDGMRCTDREGDVWWVCGVWFACPTEDVFIEVEEFNDELNHENCEDSDIMLITDRDGTVVWKRSEPLKLTLAEIAARFGVESVEVVG